MKSIRLKNTRIFTIGVLVVMTIVGCGSDDPIASTGPGPVASVQNTPTATPREIRRSDGGTTFQRADGWPIPFFGEATREEFATSIVTSYGRRVKVQMTVIQTDPLSLIIDNPLYFNGTGLEKVRVNKVKEYRTSGGVFCYRFLVNDAEVDKSTNKVRLTRGFLYPYSYYDLDGDGVFESLVVSEKDRNGLKGFQNEPDIPDWVVSNIDKDSR